MPERWPPSDIAKLAKTVSSTPLQRESIPQVEAQPSTTASAQASLPLEAAPKEEYATPARQAHGTNEHTMILHMNLKVGISIYLETEIRTYSGLL
tara:strand:- start:72 stop:356 length:285 start_codon:yes stop_codon:yes gene_type:complete